METAFFVDRPDDLVQLQLVHPHARMRLPTVPPKRKKRRKNARAQRAARLMGKMAILERQGFKCAYCDNDLVRDVATFVGVSFDHFLPASAGGRLIEENTVLCCPTCNQLKSNIKVRTIDQAKHVVTSRFKSFDGVFAEARRRAARQRASKFTIVEREILERLCHGEPQKRIASALDMGQRTLERRLWVIRQRLGVNTLAEVIAVYAGAKVPS